MDFAFIMAGLGKVFGPDEELIGESEERFVSRSALVRHLSGFLVQGGYKSLLLIFLTVSGGLLQGAGLVLLIPMLQIIGIGAAETGPGSISAQIGSILAALGLPLNLEMILFVFVLLMSTQALLLLGQAILGISLVQSYVRSIQNRLFRAITSAGLPRILKEQGSNFCHLLTHDIERLGMGTQLTVNLLRDVILTGVFLAVSFVISIPLSLLAFVNGVILLLLLRPLNFESQQTGVRLRNSSISLMSKAAESLSGLKLVKAFGFESKIVNRFEQNVGTVHSEHIEFVRTRSMTQAFSQIGGAVTLALFVYVAAVWLNVPTSDYLVMILVFSRVLPRVSTLQESWQIILHSQPSSFAIELKLDELNTGQESLSSESHEPVKLEQAIQFEEVTFRHAPDRDPVVKNLTLRIPAGRVTAILGPSGTGKTTLADLLIGLLAPQTGLIRIDGRQLDEALISRWRRSVGYVPQESFLFHDSIRENLALVKPDCTDQDLWEALHLAEADHFVSRLPQGLDTVVGDRGGRLSGGERQRIALARALLIRPTLLLLDEATSEVDRKSQEKILKTVAHLRGEMTILIIAHHAPVEELADQVLFLENGGIREQPSAQGLVS